MNFIKKKLDHRLRLFKCFKLPPAPFQLARPWGMVEQIFYVGKNIVPV